MKYKCLHIKSGSEHVSDMLNNTEFIRKYGYRNPALFRHFAQELCECWNNSVNNRDNDYFYSLID